MTTSRCPARAHPPARAAWRTPASAAAAWAVAARCRAAVSAASADAIARPALFSAAAQAWGVGLGGQGGAAAHEGLSRRRHAQARGILRLRVTVVGQHCGKLTPKF